MSDQGEAARLREENERLKGLINSPEIEDWMKGVPLEAAHQAERWKEDDPEKNAMDWFWLIGYLAQKAAFAHIAGDIEKTKHHTISTASALLNWHRRVSEGSEALSSPNTEDTAEKKVTELYNNWKNNFNETDRFQLETVLQIIELTARRCGITIPGITDGGDNNGV